jgi:hypothetical protein
MVGIKGNTEVVQVVRPFWNFPKKPYASKVPETLDHLDRTGMAHWRVGHSEFFCTPRRTRRARTCGHARIGVSQLRPLPFSPHQVADLQSLTC